MSLPRLLSSTRCCTSVLLEAMTITQPMPMRNRQRMESTSSFESAKTSSEAPESSRPAHDHLPHVPVIAAAGHEDPRSSGAGRKAGHEQAQGPPFAAKNLFGVNGQQREHGQAKHGHRGRDE